ncbi:SH3 domain-containing protein, partial [Myroides marinus]
MKRKYLNLRNLTPAFMFGVCLAGQAQVTDPPNLYNAGELTVSENEVLTVLGKFDNGSGSTFTN